MHKVDQMTQSIPRAIAEGTDPMDTQRLAGSPTNPQAITLPPTPPNPEVVEKAVRRRFTADYKLRILREADACTQSGQLGGVLRREGLYSSHVTTWRRQREQREQGTLAALAPKARGRSRRPANPLAGRLAERERENLVLQRQLRRAETMIEIQKKASASLAIPLESEAYGGPS